MRVIKCEVFSRVCGYYRPVESWNAGKKEEWNEREDVDISGAQKMLYEKPKTENENDNSK